MSEPVDGSPEPCSCDLPIPPATIDCSQCGLVGLTRHRVRACPRRPQEPTAQSAARDLRKSRPAEKRYDFFGDFPCEQRGDPFATLFCGCGGSGRVAVRRCGLADDGLLCVALTSHKTALVKHHRDVAAAVRVCETCEEREEFRQDGQDQQDA